jgi:C4-dicarboxylate-specific signal transduction histidine kinase
MNSGEQRRRDEIVRDSQAELGRVAQLAIIGELAAFIGPEVSQLLTAVVTNASAGIEWLNRKEPRLDEAEAALARIASTGLHAGETIRCLGALAAKAGPDREELDIDDTIREILVLTRSARQRHDIILRTDLSAAGRPIYGCRRRLQQVMLSLIMNSIESMSTVTGRDKILAISTKCTKARDVLVVVEDTGRGVVDRCALTIRTGD